MISTHSPIRTPPPYWISIYQRALPNYHGSRLWFRGLSRSPFGRRRWIRIGRAVVGIMKKHDRRPPRGRVFHLPPKGKRQVMLLR